MDNGVSFVKEKFLSWRIKEFFACQIFLNFCGQPMGQLSGFKKNLPPKIRKFCSPDRNRTCI